MPSLATATNPILPGFHPDPSIARLGADYYLVTSSFAYTPGLPLFRSRDLAHWHHAGHALAGRPEIRLGGPDPSDGVYAPTLHEHDGTLYLTATDTSGFGNFVVSTDDPERGWGPPVRIDRTGIDPGLAFTPDGRVLLATTATGGGVAADPARTEHAVLIGEIDLRTGARTGPVTELTRGWCGQFPEGPRFVRRGDWWYLLLAEGGTELGHMVTVGRAARPEGPYQPCPHNPVLSHRSQLHPFQSIGHADLVQAADGSWWGVCLGTRPRGNPAVAPLGRETFLVPVRWTEDDWPVFGEGGLVPDRVPLPWTADGDAADGDARRFASTAWTFLGDTARDACQDGPYGLRIHPSTALPPDGPDCAMALRRLPAPDFDATARLRPAPATTETGLVLWQDPRHHYRLAVRPADRTAVLHRTVGTVRDETPVPVRLDSSGALELGLRCRDGGLEFFAGTGAGEPVLVGTADIRYLAPEVAGGFTGVLAGVYAAGETGAHCDVTGFRLYGTEGARS